MGMNWLITGGCGFIGTSLVKNLIAEGVGFIRIIDNLSVGSRENLARICEFIEKDLDTLGSDTSQSSRVELIVADICDEELALKVSEGMDIVVHLAASTGVPESVADPRSDCLANVLGTLNYLEAARKNQIKRFIFASSHDPGDRFRWIIGSQKGGFFRIKPVEHIDLALYAQFAPDRGGQRVIITARKLVHKIKQVGI